MIEKIKNELVFYFIFFTRYDRNVIAKVFD
jgi:hypothetical protein